MLSFSFLLLFFPRFLLIHPKKILTINIFYSPPKSDKYFFTCEFNRSKISDSRAVTVTVTFTVNHTVTVAV